MLEAVELGAKVTKAQFRAAEPQLHTALLAAQQAFAEAQIPLILLVSGMEGAGRGALLNRLHKWLDTRGVRTEAFWDPTDEEQERPPFWRYWRRLPARDEIAIFFGAWYATPLAARTFGTMPRDEFESWLQRAAEFERMLTDDGALVLKFWLHVNKKTQHRRLRRQAEHGRRLTKQEKRFAKRYDRSKEVAEAVIRATNHGESPWFLVESENGRYRDLTVGRTLLDAMERRLRFHAPDRRKQPMSNPVPALHEQPPPTVLERLDLNVALGDADYQHQMADLRTRLNRLAWEAYAAGHSSVVVLEGWDAAGKGSTLRRIAAAVDARLLRVISTGAPTDEERAHHYLWRFWRHIPRAGRMTAYDRSWYGRVLVERIEGFAVDQEWMRAYQEINDFETQLLEHGMVLTKFWLHISRDEQLQRFEARQETPWKQHKLVAEDWRNREKWDAYRIAVNDMVARTSTHAAPWQLIAANDKRHARVEVMRRLCEALERRLG